MSWRRGKYFASFGSRTPDHPSASNIVVVPTELFWFPKYIQNALAYLHFECTNVRVISLIKDIMREKDKFKKNKMKGQEKKREKEDEK